jgi:hypothetical protein
MKNVEIIQVPLKNIIILTYLFLLCCFKNVACSTVLKVQKLLYKCQFHQHFTRSFFIRKFHMKLCLHLHFRFELFLAQKYWRKCNLKMLVKLTTGRGLRVIGHFPDTSFPLLFLLNMLPPCELAFLPSTSLFPF